MDTQERSSLELRLPGAVSCLPCLNHGRLLRRSLTVWCMQSAGGAAVRVMPVFVY